MQIDIFAAPLYTLKATTDRAQEIWNQQHYTTMTTLGHMELHEEHAPG